MTSQEESRIKGAKGMLELWGVPNPTNDEAQMLIRLYDEQPKGDFTFPYSQQYEELAQKILRIRETSL